MQCYCRSDIQGIAIREDVLINPPSLIEQAVQALGIFNHPEVVLQMDLRVPARYTHARYMDIVGRETPDSKQWLIQHAFTNDLAINFDQYACDGWWSDQGWHRRLTCLWRYCVRVSIPIISVDHY